MPLEAKIFNIYGADVLDVHGQHDLVHIEIRIAQGTACPHCGGNRLRKKDKR